MLAISDWLVPTCVSVLWNPVLPLLTEPLDNPPPENDPPYPSTPSDVMEEAYVLPVKVQLVAIKFPF